MRSVLASCFAVALLAPVLLSPAAPVKSYEDMAVDLLREYLQIDTTVPPGNELRAALFYKRLLDAEGIAVQVDEFAPGRANLMAVLAGSGARRPLILMNHMDVVPADAKRWSVPPFSGLLKDGMIHGRGAEDMKTEGILQLLAAIRLHREKVPLDRDVIFLATADEEAGGREGAGWFVKHHRELLGNAEFLITEGGGNNVDADGRVRAIGVGISEKTPAWLRLTATGPPGHASVPRPDSAVNRLLRALNRLLDYTPPLQLTPAVEQSFRSLAPLAPPPLQAGYANLREAIKDPELLRRLEAEPWARALLRNTISVTMLAGSNKINVIPPTASAEIDTRLVPGEKLDRWISELQGVIKDDGVKIEPILAFEANASPPGTELYEAIAAAVKRRYPDAILTLPVLPAFTDSHYFRELGIASYGFSPFLSSPREAGIAGAHGNDERISLQASSAGLHFFHEIIERLARGERNGGQ